jgi:hypothetical protein
LTQRTLRTASRAQRQAIHRRDAEFAERVDKAREIPACGRQSLRS